MAEKKITIGLEDRVPAGQAIIYGLQHILAMFAGVIAVPLIVGSAIGLPDDQKTILVQGAILACGIGTVLQTGRIGFIGAKLPICMGTAFVFIQPMIAIGKMHGMAAIFGGLIVGALIEFLISPLIWRVRNLFPPLVTGTVIVLIGLSLIPVGFRWMAGGYGDLYGQPIAFIISGSVLCIMIAANRFASGYVQTISIILAIVAGYFISGMAGILDLSVVAKANWVAIPQPFAFGMPEFIFGAILGILVAQFGSMLETIGDTFATGSVLDEEIKPEHLRGAIAVDGLGSLIGNIFSGFSLTSFSQNIGVIGITGVGSRHVVRFGGAILIVMALFPKFAALIVAMPAPVLGGAGIVMFGSVVATGVDQLSATRLDRRSLIIFSTAISIGLGFGFAGDEALANFPPALQIILHSGIVVGAIIAIFLNLVLPETKADCSPEPIPQQTNLGSDD